ncbi:MAG: hypothetical protein BWY57_03493 [Betaproteobacteria bacterium ADurb.Bin341]|jgi:hypothetical protein|nr:MAG: hypothetical protein BWY57_03493 [Betaproteobacteria bacterium ADurb.Bin341]
MKPTMTTAQLDALVAAATKRLNDYIARVAGQHRTLRTPEPGPDARGYGGDRETQQVNVFCVFTLLT